MIVSNSNQFLSFKRDIGPSVTFDVMFLLPTDVPVEKLASMESLQCVNLKSNPLNEEVRVIAKPLIKFDLLTSPALP